MYCENCGARIDDDSRFCENCGTLVGEPEPETETPKEETRDITDLDQLMAMETPAEPQISERGTVSDQTRVFVKPERKTAEEPCEETPPEKTVELEEESDFASEKEPQAELERKRQDEMENNPKEEKTEISYGLSEDDIQIPDALKPAKDVPLFWPAQPDRASWDAEDEWEEDGDWQEKTPESEPVQTAEPPSLEEQPRSLSDEEEPPEEPESHAEKESGFFARTGLGAALKSRFLAEKETWEPEEREWEKNEDAPAPEEFAADEQREETVSTAERSEEPLLQKDLSEQTLFEKAEIPETIPAEGELPAEESPEGQEDEAETAQETREESETPEPLFEPAPAEEGASPQQEPFVFCMACGKQLPAGAAFCDACGTPTGEVAPQFSRDKRASQGIVLESLKHVFVKPIQTIEKAASENGFLVGVGFFLLKDVLLAILAAALMGRLTDTLGIADSWIAKGDPFGFGAKIFLCGILADAVWMAILYGAGILFKGGGSVRKLIGACGTASLLPTVLFVVTILLLAVFAPAGACAAFVAAAICLLSMEKAVEAALRIERERQFYLTAAAAGCYLILLFLAAALLI